MSKAIDEAAIIAVKGKSTCSICFIDDIFGKFRLVVCNYWWGSIYDNWLSTNCTSYSAIRAYNNNINGGILVYYLHNMGNYCC